MQALIDKLYQRLKSCDICPRNCKVNRLENQKGYCQIAKELIVYTSFLHQGEEPAISGKNGSGTIFFSGCNLRCAYCQNHKFSHTREGRTLSEEELAGIMIDLQNQGAHNINLVTPTHILPQILRALMIAKKSGLVIPLVYNTSGYEKEEIIRKLEGVVDIYMPDLKYLSPVSAKLYSRAPDYAKFALKSLKEMHRQVDPLFEQNLLKKGLIVRHLVLPGHIRESKSILSWIKKNTPKALVSLMFQYQPYFKAADYPGISRPISKQEYLEIKGFIENLHLKGWVQDFQPNEGLAGPYFNPD